MPESYRQSAITIVHFHFNNRYNTNIGDQAHVLAIQETFQQVSNLPIQFVDKPIKLLGLKVVPLFWYYPYARYYPKFLQHLYRIAIGEPNQALLRLCRESDLILVGGGGVFMRQFLPLENKLIMRFRTPIVLFGVGYNKSIYDSYFTKRESKNIKGFTENTSFISVRDQFTLDFLEGIGQKAKLMCDPAIFLEESYYPLIKKEKNYLYVGINLANHGWTGQKSTQTKLMKVYLDLVNHIRTEYRAKIYYFMHEKTEQEIIDNFQTLDIKFDGILNICDARQLKAAYKLMDITVTMMLHASILSFGAGTPLISIGYDNKNEAFMRLIGQEARFKNVAKVTSKNLITMFDVTVLKQTQIKAEIIQKKNALWKIYREYVKECLAIAASR